MYTTFPIYSYKFTLVAQLNVKQTKACLNNFCVTLGEILKYKRNGKNNK